MESFSGLINGSNSVENAQSKHIKTGGCTAYQTVDVSSEYIETSGNDHDQL